MSEDYKTTIEKLISNVDSMKHDFSDILFRGVLEIAIFGLALIVIFMVQNLSISIEEKFYVQLLIGSGALIISATALYGTVFSKWDKTFAGYKARKMSTSLNYGKEKTVLLTALIFMKLTEPKIELLAVYRLEPEIFSKRNLIELLYKQ